MGTVHPCTLKLTKTPGVYIYDLLQCLGAVAVGIHGCDLLSHQLWKIALGPRWAVEVFRQQRYALGMSANGAIGSGGALGQAGTPARIRVQNVLDVLKVLELFGN